MLLGRVVGCVWSTVKDSHLEGQRLLLVEPLTPELKPAGKRLVCADWTGAGAGEMVYWVRGREASIAFLPGQPPSDATIVGIVDSVHRAAAKTSKPARQPERSHDRKGVASSPGRNIAPPEN